jgi:ATP synthase protein I
VSNFEVGAFKKSYDSQESDDAQELEFKPLTREQAQALRERNPQISPWRMILMQAIVGVFVAVLAAVITTEASAGWSAGYGALAVIVPCAMFAWGLSHRPALVNAGSVMLAFFLWESVKIVVTVVMLFAAPLIVAQLNWLALVVGFVVTMKVSWLAVLRRSRKPASVD